MTTLSSHALATIERRMGFALPARFIELHARRSDEYIELLDFFFPALGPTKLDVDRDSPFALIFKPDDEDEAETETEEDTEDEAEDERARDAATFAFLRARRLLPIAFSRESLLCFDAMNPRDGANWPIRSYKPLYFHEGNPDFIRWTDDEYIGPIVASSIDRLLEFRSCVAETDDASWGSLVAQFTAIDPEGAGTEAARTFWTRVVALCVGKTTEPSRWRRIVAVFGTGLGVQIGLYPMAQHALDKQQPEIALAIAGYLTAPEYRMQGRIMRVHALAALGRHDESEADVLALATEWLAPAVPFSPNQLLGKREMLDLLRPFRSLEALRLFTRVAHASKPEVVM